LKWIDRVWYSQVDRVSMCKQAISVGVGLVEKSMNNRDLIHTVCFLPPFCIAILFNFWLRWEIVWENSKIGYIIDKEDTIFLMEVRSKNRIFLCSENEQYTAVAVIAGVDSKLGTIFSYQATFFCSTLWKIYENVRERVRWKMKLLIESLPDYLLSIFYRNLAFFFWKKGLLRRFTGKA
jgi:hypothetical protein